MPALKAVKNVQKRTFTCRAMVLMVVLLVEGEVSIVACCSILSLADSCILYLENSCILFCTLFLNRVYSHCMVFAAWCILSCTLFSLVYSCCVLYTLTIGCILLPTVLYTRIVYTQPPTGVWALIKWSLVVSRCYCHHRLNTLKVHKLCTNGKQVFH